MTKRDPLNVILLGIVTCGIYFIVWFVQTKDEMNQLGAEIPTALLLLVPFVGIYWFWEYSRGVELATKGKSQTLNTFLLLVLCSIVGIPITVKAFNEVSP